jgi:hypothetical protein
MFEVTAQSRDHAQPCALARPPRDWDAQATEVLRSNALRPTSKGLKLRIPAMRSFAVDRTISRLRRLPLMS